LRFSLPNSSHLSEEIWKYEEIFIYILQESMTATKPIFRKFVCARQMFVNNSYTDFHESSRNYLVDYARSVIDGQTDESPLHKRSSSLLPKELLTKISLLPHRKQAASPGQNPVTFLY
jgi:hypothetical protein